MRKLNRRQFLSLTAGSFAAALISPGCETLSIPHATAATANKPNIILVMAETFEIVKRQW